MPSSDYKLTIKLLVEFVAAIAIVFSMIWSIMVLKHQDAWLRKVETLHTLNSRDKSHFGNIYRKISPLNNSDSLLNCILSDSVLRTEITDQLIIFEDISIGSNIGIYDNEIIKKFMGNSFIKFNQKIQPYILYTRKKNNNPNLCIEYDNCVKALLESK